MSGPSQTSFALLQCLHEDLTGDSMPSNSTTTTVSVMLIVILTEVQSIINCFFIWICFPLCPSVKAMLLIIDCKDKLSRKKFGHNLPRVNEASISKEKESLMVANGSVVADDTLVSVLISYLQFLYVG